MIIEAVPVVPRREAGWAGPVVPWVVSAKSESALRGQAARLAAYVRGDDGLDVADVEWSLAGRSVSEHRAVVGGEDRDRLLRPGSMSWRVTSWATRLFGARRLRQVERCSSSPARAPNGWA
ncbi:hypothetical protein ACQKB3_20960, partial [Mycobacterium tuberculosis]